MDCCKDELSKEYFQVIKETVQSEMASRKICDLYKGEKQYFLKEFKGKLDGLL